MTTKSSLSEKLRKQVETEGPLSVEQWMAACLADPDDGYYMTRDPFGRSGDFITAPEISQMFGELLGLWSAVMWQSMGAPAEVRLVELGPGRGTLMADALRAANSLPGFIDAVSVHMVETSPVLKGSQQNKLANARCSVDWHDSLETVPDGPMIVLANEFLDALPVQQWIFHNGQWFQRMVGHDGEAFVFAIGAPVDPEDVPDFLSGAAEGAIFETSPVVSRVIETLARRLHTDIGAALLIDYGHTKRGAGETLQALKGHQFADPLQNPGEQDLTAHVDFAYVAEIAKRAGAGVWGPLPQGALLERMGIAARATRLLLNASKQQAEDIATARHRLVDDGAMGRLFKAVALTHPELAAPPGFEGSSAD